MALSVREVLLVLRAKDQASRVIADVGRSFGRVGEEADLFARRQIHAGQALLGVGVAMTAAGAAGIAFYASLTKDAVEYNRQAALTLTQVDQAGVSLEQIKDIARRVGSEVAAPFDQMQTTLYDIFSSTNASLPQAELLLHSFSKSAVAGQVDIQDAARATIAILNAFGRPLEDVTEVEDVMFQLVRKGIGTYEEFATTIGRAIPSTVRAGQEIEDLAGMLAFLTRNGLSTAMAAASAGRALDSYAHPKVVERLEKMGIDVKNSEGGFRRIDQVVQDLAKHMGPLTDPQRSSFLQDLFEGAGGTIQARRFWDVALQQPEMLSQFTAFMDQAAGAADEAYQIMFDQPASKMQLLKNNWEILKTQIGDVVIPVFERLIEVASKILQWFTGMDPKMRRLIVYVSLAISVFLVLTGILTGLVGVMLIFAGVLSLLSIPLAPFIAALGIAIALMAALVGIFLYFFTQSEEFRDFLSGLKEDLAILFDIFNEEGWKAAVKALWEKLKEDFKTGIDTIWQDMQAGWDRILAQAPDTLMKIIDAIATWVGENLETAIGWGADFASSMWDGFVDFMINLPDKLATFVGAIEDWVAGHIDDFFAAGLQIGEEIARGIASGMLDLFHGVPLLGWAADDISGWLNLGNQGRGGPPVPDLGDNAEAVSGIIRGFGAGQLGMYNPDIAPGYSETTVTDVHDNNFFVADLQDMIDQLAREAKLNAKATGNAQPSGAPALNTPFRAPKATATAATLGAKSGVTAPLRRSGVS